MRARCLPAALLTNAETPIMNVTLLSCTHACARYTGREPRGASARAKGHYLVPRVAPLSAPPR